MPDHTNATAAAERLRDLTDGPHPLHGPFVDDVRAVLDERDALAAAVERVRALCALPDPNGAPGYQPYAVQLGEDVRMAVLVDDLRATLDGDAT